MTLEFGTVIPGNPSPAGEPAWIRATFTQLTEDSVGITIKSLLGGGGEFARVLAFSYGDVNPANGRFVPGNLAGAQATGFSGVRPAATAVNPGNGFAGLGAPQGRFQLGIAYATSSPRLDGKQESSFTLTRAGGIDVTGFGVANADGFIAVARVQGLAKGQSTRLSARVVDDGTQAVPEPSALVLTALGMLAPLGVAGVRRWRRPAGGGPLADAANERPA